MNWLDHSTPESGEQVATPHQQPGSQRPPSVRPVRIAPVPTGTPPPHGLPLGLTLGLVLTIAISLVIGVITAIDLRQELVMERRMFEARLAERLAELRDELASVTQSDELATVLARVRHEAEASSRTTTSLELRDIAGRRVALAAPETGGLPPPDAVRATIDITCPALNGGAGLLEAWQSSAPLNAHRSQLWREWALELLLTSLAVILVVEVAVYFLVGRPLLRLVGILRRFEQGHVGPVDPGPGGWEIRWLAWRFEHLGRELADNARRLVAAERRALDAARVPSRSDDTLRHAPVAGAEDGSPIPQSGSRENPLVRQYLQDTCRLLETLDPHEPVAHEIAEEAWTAACAEADRVGDYAIKAQLEDAALRILEHREFTALDAELATIRRRRLAWSRWVGQRLAEVVAEAGVEVHEIQHRVKHTAGVWRKMREARIAVDEVHDLFAFRIIVPSDHHCYVALGAIHRSFEPEPFRFKDYIQSPKNNGYRSLHTTVRDAEGRLFEVQIRTPEMHDSAENGAAAHWRYRADRWGSLASLRPRSWWHRIGVRLGFGR